MNEIGLKDLLQAGVHFGHQTRKWNPKMKPYIFMARGGIYIIDLQKTLASIRRAADFMRDVAGRGGTVLWVGTKKQAKVAIRDQASRCGSPYVTERWLGGTLTNYSTIYKSVQRLEDIEAMMSDGRMANFSKKEQLEINRTYEKLQKNLGGIRRMKGLPAALFVVDTAEEETAVREAQKLGIPIVGVVDTNANPDVINFPIPGNDDAIRAVNLYARAIANAIEEGRAARAEGRGPEETQRPAPPASATVERPDAGTPALATEPSRAIRAAAGERPGPEQSERDPAAS